MFWHICCQVIDKIKNVKFRVHCINVNRNQMSLNIDLFKAKYEFQQSALKEILALAKALYLTQRS